MHIETIKIEGLWGKYQINWHLNPDVNILAGINGSGKSTVLNLMAGILRGGDFVGISNVDESVDGGEIAFNDNKIIKFISTPKTEKDMPENIQKFFSDIQARNITLRITTTNFKGFENKNLENISDIIKINRISTFEQPLKIKDISQTQYLPEKVETDLDYQIFELQRTYLSYQITLSKRIEQAFLESEHLDTKAKREEIYGKKELFLKTINQFFGQTGKTIDSDKNNEIVFRQEDKILTPYQLSSGEKQVLIILLSVLIQDNAPYILIMDEPEISLHVEWQEELIKVIRSLNNNVQVILATHSPSLVMNGWLDKITNMEDITS
ncbi:ABC transporter ATP-binding protein [Beggiatoa sp. PS]|nr:ABC transporter ATP-binding protein [Beggiatoa sp. PS]